MDEFALIRKYFTRAYSDVDLGVGDDAALVQVRPDHQLVVSVDTLVEGVHFFTCTDPFALGYKSLAVNLSDMAAMGANPRWATLCLTIPEINSAWLHRFSTGLFNLAEQYQVSIIGGDTSQGALSISMQILGEVPFGQAITRTGAKEGDDIWVAGELGLAAMAVEQRYGRMTLLEDDAVLCAKYLDYPFPKIALGIALRGVAHAMLDVSDGLLADLAHITTSAKLGAEIWADALPPAKMLKQYYPELLAKQLTGGDDYALCFAASPHVRSQVMALATSAVPLYRVGRIVLTPGVRCLLANGTVWQSNRTGYQHFTAI